MVGLVDDLLLLAQLDQGRPLTRAQVDITALLGDLVHDTTAANPQRSVGVDIADGLQVTGDPDRLSQVFTNLLRNAMVHTPSTAAVTVTARRHDLPDHRVVVEVSDNGPGLTAEQAVQVFDRFYRGDPSRARDRGGAGLGLPIARSIVAAHGGRLTLRTEPGRGATFTVEMPAE
jgi:two-component system OmpR family sensor kinase